MWKQVFSIFAIFSSGINITYAQEVNAQEKIITMQLSDGTKVVMNTETVPVQVQDDVLATLQGCIVGGEHSRDQCIVTAATILARERLDAVIRVTQTELQPLEEEIGVPVVDLIRKPLYCDYSPTDEILETCQTNTEAVTLAGLDVEIAETRARRIEAETRVADKAAGLEEIETRIDAGQADLDDIETRVDEKRQTLERAQGEEMKVEEDLAVANAVLAALQRVAAENP